ncbi:hypothetical protein [Nocardioides sp.]|uniref:hypothetical protein n=1 Tax=Nocardioides sp. TaxID=35761 RepID=UPI002C9EB260|nr:hypothetical protein [Nocardioides sp.]HXH80942.1 hypothetical protein [Nocardioides sp.]
MRMSRSSIVLLVVVIALINLPLVLATWTRSSVERNGVEVQATINEAKNLGTSAEPSWWLNYTLPESVDPEQGKWSAEVDAATYEQAERDGTVAVTALEDQPESAIVTGEIRSSAGLVGTLVADAVMAALLALLWRSRGGRLREVVTVEALEDVSPAAGAGSWEDLDDGTVRVSGDVLEADQHEVLLELEDRLVRVVLDGHASAVDVRQTAQVRARHATNPNGPTNPASR